MKNEHDLFRYEEIVDKIQSIIKNLNLKPGDRVPSLRQVCKELEVSLATALQAYRTLEAKGLVISRPKSGYFVNATTKNNLIQKPHNDKYIPLPINVTLNTMIANMLVNMKQFGLVNFFIFAPVNELLPISRISKAVRDALKDTNSDSFQYPLIEGHPRLVKQIARQTFDWELSLSTEHVLVTNGCTEAINLCLDAIAQPGDIILIESPAPYGILQSLALRNLLALEVPVHPETGLYLDQLEFAIAQHKVTACVLTTVINAPMGCAMPKENILKLLEILKKNNIPLIEDDALGDLSFTHPRPLPAKAYDLDNNVLYCTSFSKSLGPGFRIGWVSGGKYHEKIKRLKYMSNFFTNGILQDAIGRFLETGLYNSHLKRMKTAMQQNLARYMDSINNHYPPDIKISTPKGGLCLWMELPAHIDALELQRRAIDQGIGICPGQIFTASNQYNNFIRLNYCLLWTPKIDKHLKKLGTLIINYNNPQR
ncbi:PLP-dependent aminotransferase family protein [Pedobacter hiemivivus]|uniref:PLP-dependent aminotransferase family protein n=1 Tax=Pedobacter hiemivivus TaxID=2530454 RepID=A0A4U1GEM6_9SPHI|nr:PLP-dependent aminotransferase family protein [Pedobacter hiemivivus]TKC62388.1 PLP-dependent aminotransferase family protein [Pedobacter hiemivivus]